MSYAAKMMDRLGSVDSKPIRSVSFGTDGNETIWAVDGNSVTAIEPYMEPGPLGPSVWFRVMKNETVVARINSLHVVIVRY